MFAKKRSSNHFKRKMGRMGLKGGMGNAKNAVLRKSRRFFIHKKKMSALLFRPVYGFTNRLAGPNP